jgi:hypothetical protein
MRLPGILSVASGAVMTPLSGTWSRPSGPPGPGARRARRTVRDQDRHFRDVNSADGIVDLGTGLCFRCDMCWERYPPRLWPGAAAQAQVPVGRQGAASRAGRRQVPHWDAEPACRFRWVWRPSVAVLKSVMDRIRAAGPCPAGSSRVRAGLCGSRERPGDHGGRMSWRVVGECVEQAAFDTAGLVAVRPDLSWCRAVKWPGTMILP